MSRASKPKQLQNLVSDKTLLQETFARVAKVVSEKNIYISTTPGLVDEIMKQLPQITEDKFIIEPASRDTMASFGLIISRMLEVDSTGTFCAIPSDHLVGNDEAFVQAFKVAFEVVEKYPDSIATIGINPTRPETGLGYIKMGKQKGEVDGDKFFSVDKFVEKPDLETAQKYLQSWEYLWNTAYYFANIKGVEKLFKEKRPKAYGVFQKINKLIASSEEKGNGIKTKTTELYGTVEKEPIANLASENPDRVLVIPSDMDWSDVGDWGSLHDVLSKNYDSSMISKGYHLDINSERCLVYGNEKMIATIGLQDVIIVDTPDAILIANKNKAQDVKKLLDKLKEEGKHLYL